MDEEECLNTIQTIIPVHSLKLISNDYLLSGNNNGDVQVWSLAENKCIKSFKAHSECIMALKILNNN